MIKNANALSGEVGKRTGNLNSAGELRHLLEGADFLWLRRRLYLGVLSQFSSEASRLLFSCPV